MSQRNESFTRWLRYLHIACGIVVLLVLGSCVNKIDSIGGGHGTTRKMAGIFFFHLFLLVPCLLAVYVIVQTKLEKALLGQQQVDRMNEAFIKSRDKNIASVLGPFASIFKSKDKK